MNREQRRNIEKKLKNSQDIDKVMALLGVKDDWYFKEGTKVKLNLERIKSHPDYDKLTDKYKAWVTHNQNTVFAVEYDEKHKDKPSVVCLKEDTTRPKWLFWTGDLTEIKE